MFLLVTYVLVALAVSFMCSLLEAVLLSITPAYVALLEKEGSRAGTRLRTLKEDIERPLAAILSLNTVAHTVGAAGAGAQAAKVFGSASVGMFSAVLTLLVLVLSEIIPKTLGAVHWKRLAPYLPRVLHALVLLVWPLVKVSQWLSALLTPAHRGATVSREEITALASEGVREGVVAEGETRVLSNLLRLSRLCARDVMTPMEHVVALPGDMPVAEALDRMEEHRFSRLPLRMAGESCPASYVLKDEILALGIHHELGVPLSSLGRQLLRVPEQMKLPKVFDEMAERREHIAVAVNGDHAPVGIVTMEDIIETLLGMEIFDETDDEQRIRSLARSCWTDRAKRLGLVPA